MVEHHVEHHLDDGARCTGGHRDSGMPNINKNGWGCFGFFVVDSGVVGRL
jgi:hypothetical protein